MTFADLVTADAGFVDANPFVYQLGPDPTAALDPAGAICSCYLIRRAGSLGNRLTHMPTKDSGARAIPWQGESEMATSAHSSSAPDGAKPQTAGAPRPAKGLRLWPALILLALLAGTRFLGNAFDDIPPALFPVIFFGPVVAVALAALWWLFASRARILDRLMGLLLLAGTGFASYWFAHQSVQGMVFVFYALPVAAGAFLLTLILLAWLGRGAVWAAILVGVACFLTGALVRNEGFTGDFQAAFDWRWKPSAGEQYLASLKTRQPAALEAGRKEVTDIGPVRWSEFRGPRRDGVVAGVRLNTDWGAKPPREIWRRKIGPGWSSFAAVGDLLFTQEQRGDMEAVVCCDANTGSEVWTYEYPSRFWEAVAGDGPRATPTLHEGALFALGAKGVLCRLDARTGARVWTRDLCKDAEREPPLWGFSSSPLVVHGCVVVHAGGAGDKGVLAYDVQTGDLRWGAPAGDHSYSSPQLATLADRDSLLMLTNTGLHAYDPRTGQPQWEHEWKFEQYRVVQPLVVGKTSVLLGTGMGAGTRRIDLTTEGATTAVAERWTSLAIKPNFNDFVAHRGHLYGFDNNLFTCIDLETGQKKWKEGRYGNGQVLLLPAGDQLLVLSEKGDLVLLRATPDRHEEKARHPALKGKTWNHPILVGNRLYVRNGEEAACFELSLVGGP